MSHPSEALLLAFADNELDDARRQEVRAHVQECGLCRYALRDLETALAGLTVELALVDAGESPAWHAQAAGNPQRPRPARPPNKRQLTAGRGRETPFRRLATLRWAAALMIVVAAGAAAMVVPQWRRSEPLPAVASTEHPDVRAVEASTEVAMSRAAVSILPDRGEATVALTSSAGAGDGRVMVVVSERRDVQVTVSTATTEQSVPRFTSAEGRLAVQLSGHGSVVLVELPASLRSARITHDGRTIVTVQGDAIRPVSALTTGIVLAVTQVP